MKILLIEDDSETAAYVANGLQRNGYVVEIAGTGPDGLKLASGNSYDLFIVDRMLPGLDGLSIVRILRDQGIQTPVLFLTAMADVDERVEGLNAGGDDYLTKPFAYPELLARVQALLRRPATAAEPTALKVGDLELDLLRRKAVRAGQALDLLPIEFRLLEYLMRNAGQTVTRTMLLEHVWDFNFDPKTNVVETNISRLRTKVDKPFHNDLIRTVRGTGYRVDEKI